MFNLSTGIVEREYGDADFICKLKVWKNDWKHHCIFAGCYIRKYL
jgi:hypothetical protein